MTITLNAWWLHTAVTIGALWWLVAVIDQAGDYDFGAPLRAAIPIFVYLLYWIVYLVLT